MTVLDNIFILTTAMTSQSLYSLLCLVVYNNLTLPSVFVAYLRYNIPIIRFLLCGMKMSGAAGFFNNFVFTSSGAQRCAGERWKPQKNTATLTEIPRNYIYMYARNKYYATFVQNVAWFKLQHGFK